MAYKKKLSPEDSKFARIQSNIGKKHYEALLRFAKMHNLTISRLIAIAIDNEIYSKEKPFKIDLTLPSEVIEYAYADEAGRILNYLRTQTVGMSLDMLYILRHDIGISDLSSFLGGFKECLDKGILETYKAPDSVKYTTDTLLYRVVTGKPTSEDKAEIKKLSRYEKYLALKKEFENDASKVR